MVKSTRAAFQYDSRAGSSHYGIKPGVIVELKGTTKRFNPKVGITTPHRTLLWLQCWGALPKGVQPRDRPIRVLRVLLPVIGEYQRRPILIEGYVQHNSIRKEMKRRGWKVMATGIPLFTHKRDCYEKPYKLMGLIK